MPTKTKTRPSTKFKSAGKYDTYKSTRQAKLETLQRKKIRSEKYTQN